MQEPSTWSKAGKLFNVFFRIGAFTFGGGYAMIPLIQREISEKNGWIEDEDVLDIFAIVQSVPGVIAINSSIFIGYRVAGFIGALAATLGVALPSLIIISVIALFFYSFRDLDYIHEAFIGIRAGVTALIIFAVIKLGKPSVKKAFGWSLAVSSFIAVALLGLNAILVLLSAAIIGFVVNFLFKEYHQKRKGSDPC